MDSIEDFRFAINQKITREEKDGWQDMCIMKYKRKVSLGNQCYETKKTVLKRLRDSISNCFQF